MQLIKISPALIALFATLAFASAGCAEKGEEGEVDGAMPEYSQDIQYADGWTELNFDANSAKSRVNTMGHYHTDKNICQKPGDGVYSVAAWNKLVGDLNRVAGLTDLATPRCWDSPNGSKFYNKGLAELTITRSSSQGPSTAVTKKKLFEFKNGQICTAISDAALADTLMEQVETTLKLIDRADAQECPGYHPDPQ
jgi:hypothetical protein